MARVRELTHGWSHMTVVLDGGPLALADVAAVSRDGAHVSVGPEAARRVAEARRFVDEVAGSRGADLRHHDRRRQAEGRRDPSRRAGRAATQPRAEPRGGRGRHRCPRARRVR